MAKEFRRLEGKTHSVLESLKIVTVREDRSGASYLRSFRRILVMWEQSGKVLKFDNDANDRK